MSVPTSDQQDEILSTVGDFSDGFLAGKLAYVWAKYDILGGRLQILYTKRDLLDMAMGRLRESIDFQTPTDVSMQASQLLNNILKMRNAIQQEIDKLENNPGGVVSDGSSFSSFVGELTTTGSSSLNGFSGEIDVNSIGFRGSPYPWGRYRRLP
jgi:hypothetical protein